MHGHWKNLQMIPEGICEKSFSSDFMFEELISLNNKNFILEYKGKAFSKNPMSPVHRGGRKVRLIDFPIPIRSSDCIGRIG
jgi:hypothetical protein